MSVHCTEKSCGFCGTLSTCAESGVGHRGTESIVNLVGPGEGGESHTGFSLLPSLSCRWMKTTSRTSLISLGSMSRCLTIGKL